MTAPFSQRWISRCCGTSSRRAISESVKEGEGEMIDRLYQWWLPDPGLTASVARDCLSRLVCASPVRPGDQRLAGERRARRPVVHQQVPRRRAWAHCAPEAASPALTRRAGAGRTSLAECALGANARQGGLGPIATRLQRRRSKWTPPGHVPASPFVANQQPDALRKQQRRRPRAVRLAHHPGDAAVRRARRDG